MNFQIDIYLRNKKRANALFLFLKSYFKIYKSLIDWLLDK